MIPLMLVDLDFEVLWSPRVERILIETPAVERTTRARARRGGVVDSVDSQA